jgi:hypothetical protein
MNPERRAVLGSNAYAVCVDRNNRLRVSEARVFYDISDSTVEILAIVTKSEVEAWLSQFGDPV